MWVVVVATQERPYPLLKFCNIDSPDAFDSHLLISITLHNVASHFPLKGIRFPAQIGRELHIILAVPFLYYISFCLFVCLFTLQHWAKT